MGSNKEKIAIEKILIAIIIIVVIVAGVIIFIYVNEKNEKTLQAENNARLTSTQNTSVDNNVNKNVKTNSSNTTIDNEESEQNVDNEENVDIEKLKAEQKLTCKKAMLKSQDNELKNLYPDVLLAEVKNNTDEIVKEYNIIFLAYDENYLPVKMKEYAGDKAEYFLVGKDDTANLVAGDSTKMNRGWEIEYPHEVQYVIACVRDAKFFNGEKWENPYITYWLDKYEGKILPEEDREDLIPYE